MANYLIERAALAAAEAVDCGPLVDDPERRRSLGPSELDGDQWRAVVRAVLEAIREPTEAMEKAAGDRRRELGHYDDSDPAEIFTCMIDAALADATEHA